MKKILFLLLFAFLLCGCGGEKEVQQPEPKPESESSVVQKETEPKPESESSVVQKETEPKPESTLEPISLSVVFIDVGEGDAIFVECNHKTMLVDGGSNSSLMYSYLSQHGVNHLDYVVCSHPHGDHVGGLAGALNYATVDTAYCPFDTYDLKEFNDFTQYLSKQGVTITIPKPGDTFSLGAAVVEVLGPVIQSENLNDDSLVMKLSVGDISFLFTGDMEKEEEQSLIDSGCDLESTVLKVGHHGSNTSTSQTFLERVAPQCGVISVGKNNGYDFPSEEVIQLLNDKAVSVYRTDMQGDIVCTTDGSTLSFNVDPVKYVPSSLSVESEQISYVLNTNTKKFHYPSCSSVETIKDKNRQDFTGSREEAINMGYDPCGRCNP